MGYLPSISHRSPVYPYIQLQVLIPTHTPLMQDGLHRAGCGLQFIKNNKYNVFLKMKQHFLDTKKGQKTRFGWYLSNKIKLSTST